MLAEVVPQVEELWAATLARYAAGQPHYTVEEHVLNAVLWRRGEQHDRAGAFIQRVRTLPPPYGTRERVHPGLVAWHLPMEKDAGFLRVHRHLAQRPACDARHHGRHGHSDVYARQLEP